MRLEIPFLQRKYVWDESNWEELLKNVGPVYPVDEKNLTSTGLVQIFVVMPNLQCVVLLHVEIRECYWLLRSYSMLLHVQLSVYQADL